MTSAQEFLELGEAGWRWVRDQVRWDDGPWVPEPPGCSIPEDPENMHSGTGGLAHTLAEIRQLRDLDDDEAQLADAIATRVRAALGSRTSVSYFGGLVSDIGVLVALDADGVEVALGRLLDLAEQVGWPDRSTSGWSAGATFNDATLGTGGVLLSAVWAGGELGAQVAGLAAEVLLAEAEPTAHGLTWHVLPLATDESQPVSCRTGRTAWPASRLPWPSARRAWVGLISLSPLDEGSSIW